MIITNQDAFELWYADRYWTTPEKIKSYRTDREDWPYLVHPPSEDSSEQICDAFEAWNAAVEWTQKDKA